MTQDIIPLFCLIHSKYNKMEEKHQTKCLKKISKQELAVLVEEIANKNKILIGKYDKDIGYMTGWGLGWAGVAEAARIINLDAHLVNSYKTSVSLS